jgi:hypothetical protein
MLNNVKRSWHLCCRLVARGSDALRRTSELEEAIEVVGVTPIHGLGIDRNRIPANVQTAPTDLSRPTRATSVAEQMLQTMASVHINEVTTNPFQPDLSSGKRKTHILRGAI